MGAGTVAGQDSGTQVNTSSNGGPLDLTEEQASRLDWDGDGGSTVDVDDIVALFGKKLRVGSAGELSEGQNDVFDDPLIPGFDNPPQNTGELDSTLYEDLDGDGVENQDAVEVFGFIVRAQGDGGTGLPTESATVSVDNTNLVEKGNTAETAVSIDASSGIGAVDVTVSVDSPNVEIANASVADQPGSSLTSINQTDSSVNISYTDIQSVNQQFDLADIKFNATGNLQDSVDINVDVPFSRVAGTNNVELTTDEGDIIGADPVGNATVESIFQGSRSVITVDAEEGLGAADVTLSINTSVAAIKDVRPGSDVDETAPSVDFTSEVESGGGSATVSYTNVGASSSQLSDFELARVELEFLTEDGQTDLSVGSGGLFAPGGGVYSVQTNSASVSPGLFSEPLLSEFSSPPANTGDLNSTLYEDLDGDGDGTEVDPTVALFGELIRGEDLGLTPTQADRLDWDRDNGDSVDIDDMVALFGEKIRARQ